MSTRQDNKFGLQSDGCLRMPNREVCRNGFTLIELLVVIAIIAILARSFSASSARLIASS